MQDQTALLRKIDETVGMYMTLMRLEGKISPDHICELLEISPSTLRAYERGERAIPASKLYLFADFLGVKMDFFFMDLISRLMVSG